LRFVVEDDVVAVVCGDMFVHDPPEGLSTNQ
jgi:hypothetical protein